MSRKNDLDLFYRLLLLQEEKLDGKKTFSELSARNMNFPQRGIYFIFESGEHREKPDITSRVVRVGTHAITSRSNSTLWTRLSQHRGTANGGNHRGSVFRLIIGQALLTRDNLDVPSWGIGSDMSKAANKLGVARENIRSDEKHLEIRVSEYISQMSLLWLAIDDEPGPLSDRGYLEKNSISLLSNYGKPAIYGASEQWLGQYSNREKIRKSGLWNSRHVDENYDPAFLKTMKKYITD